MTLPPQHSLDERLPLVFPAAPGLGTSPSLLPCRLPMPLLPSPSSLPQLSAPAVVAHPAASSPRAVPRRSPPPFGESLGLAAPAACLSASPLPAAVARGLAALWEATEALYIHLHVTLGEKAAA
ncbi:hypothetical protein HYH03_009848 [Edaphochlamys debaryana]|uniref:Uncharacterized protein n=1 Tax=Edaphochlamys debaryana TaxID=47281 RepID=A0A835XXA2_9CHLO|nr:hypothetical protein HYH03_009848 [Edaphochlamys debaryana]|eukprot:KAG2491896.1 hypothetical protein HYH03_009848 [Edaphochlamys debaryana]